MNNKKIRAIGALILVVLWLGLTVFAWLKPADTLSLSERRELKQFPTLSGETVLKGEFMTGFESYTLDQFPLRDTFRKLKAFVSFNVLDQNDNNGIFLHDGYAAKVEYPLNEKSVTFALEKFSKIRDRYLKAGGCKIYAAVVPDKSYYLGEDSGILTMDYDKLFAMVQEGMPWAKYIDLTGELSLEDYYYTDTHWRQEKLIPAAAKLCQAMGAPAPQAGDYTVTETVKDFYGVYYGQAALPMDPEPLYTMQSDLLSGCTVLNHETGKRTQVYDMDKLTAHDPYDIYLSGATALLTIENPNAKTGKELIVFRDSFGSSVIPLLVQGYRTVTVVDLRYMSSDFLNQYIRFRGQDVLFLYSSLVLNSAFTLK